MKNHVLPHEKTLLSNALVHAESELRIASLEIGKSSEGSEFHDNSAWDEAINETSRRGSTVGSIRHVFDHYVEVEYPKPDSTVIALGSLVMAADKFGKSAYAVVGTRGSVMHWYDDAWKEKRTTDKLEEVDFSVVTPESMLGSSMIGLSAGETFTYEAPNGNTMEVQIEAVDQTWISDTFNK